MTAEANQGSSSYKTRFRSVVKAAAFGLAVNVVLALFKFLVGFAAGSIAIEIDAFNNLADGVSTVVIIVAMFVSVKKADAKHPYGYGRFEYMAAIFVALGIFYIGVQALIDSGTRILHPQTPDYTWLTVFIIAVAIVAKYFMSRYLVRTGNKYDSSALSAAGVDAKGDVLLTSGTLLAALVGIFFNFDIDGIVGFIIAIAIIKIAIDTLRDSVAPVIGNKVDNKLSHDITQFVMKNYPVVEGVYDLSIIDFGPETSYGTFHIELPDTLSAREVSELTRKMAVEAHKKFHVIFTVGFYVTNTDAAGDKDAKRVLEIASAHPEVKNVHALYVDTDNHSITFDVIVDFAAEGQKIIAQIKAEVEQAFPGYTVGIVEDTDFSA